MSNDRPVSLELHHEVEQFLYSEARLLDGHGMREWLDTMVDPAVRYQVVVHEERFRRDRRPAESGTLFIYDDNFDVLSMRVRQFESGLQTMLDPLQRLRRVVANVSAFHGEQEGQLRVLSYGIVSRFRRLYEHEQVVFGREDTLHRDEAGALRLLARRVDLDERVSRNKNLLFFL
ncbi:aromatic-ring-hydroxylating dioxygenase subunit beta [Novosphingobium malaysiense]|uniref:Aromatic-ring-hydroxylating dioxygenase n=1 Tax=Novosphingobium malaysiense TaxID=1348853 RepID=A0A0B1ZUY4_9SPHN|nr:aromatic-ring-hydroxylating dioxygenase subunit beta [Novosphingobium malaysiense]KHK92937.1 hypothetical protein LK12_00660 [Novosphingobium malaysiense]